MNTFLINFIQEHFKNYMFSKKVKRKIQCLLCPHECVLQEGKVGICGVRGNLGGRIKCRAYGKISGYANDPIEKKPLYHFYPGSKILSIGSFGCNLKCNFCQNWQISLGCKIDDLSGKTTTVDEILKDACDITDNIGIAYTYNEPTVWFEFMYDIALKVRQRSLKNVVVSNGYINEDPLNQLLLVIDAFNIDLKAFNENFYHEMSGGSLAPVLETLKTIKKAGKHLEITNLVIPKKNDNLDSFCDMVDWIANELGSDVVLHLSRYFPKYKQSLPYTPEETLVEMYSKAKTKLKYVYLGNLTSEIYSNTNCSNCNTTLIERIAYKTKFTDMYSAGKCLKCDEPIDIMM